MRVILGSDLDGIKLKAEMKQYLLQEKVEVIDKSESASEDFIEATLAVAHEVLKYTESLGIVFDGYGAGSFMTAA
ncbi:MAG: RpiB/LacA/LacB family sugar-phosphate isomerase, partial [Enterococcus faecalis]|nr:RpiB/LacA/LacB family sugar-phosphate isomerase [Enterococcus faecalis]